MRTVFSVIVLLSLWLLMSGLFEPLLIGLGIFSSVVAVWVTKRMDAQDGDHLEIKVRPLKFAGYLAWLAVEIARANWTVAKIVLASAMPLRQHMFIVPCTQKSDLAQVLFANSITLTPGTITVETESNGFLVHAVAYDDNTPGELAKMNARVAAVEYGRES